MTVASKQFTRARTSCSSSPAHGLSGRTLAACTIGTTSRTTAKKGPRSGAGSMPLTAHPTRALQLATVRVGSLSQLCRRLRLCVWFGLSERAHRVLWSHSIIVIIEDIARARFVWNEYYRARSNHSVFPCSSHPCCRFSPPDATDNSESTSEMKIKFDSARGWNFPILKTFRCSIA